MAVDGHNRRRFKLKAGEYNWYKEQVAKDPDFLDRLRTLAAQRARSFPRHNSTAIRTRITALATEYDLSVEDLDELLVTTIGGGTLKNNRGYIGFDLGAREASVTYSIDHCSDVEARELLERSLAARRRDFTRRGVHRRRLPDDPELLYAIHRALASGLDRQGIFDRYAAGELSSSKPNLTQYPTPADLMGYYYKHTVPK